MRILGIGGSPRVCGNTDVLLEKALEGARQNGAVTEKIILNELEFSPCQECEKAGDDGVCIIRDDMQSVYSEVEIADAVILASPIFFGSISAQMKMMIDRFQCVWRTKQVVGKDVSPEAKRGAFIAVEASRREEFFSNASSIVKNFFATAGIKYREELFCPGVDRKGAILENDDFSRKAFEIGRRISKDV